MSDEAREDQDRAMLAADRFDPSKRIGNYMGRDYLDVANRVLWLTKDEANYAVDTDIVHVDDQSAVVKATVTTYNVDGTTKRRATGHGRAAMATMPKHIASRFLEKAETAAIGRALAALGYGTLAAQTFDDTDGPHLADTPADKPARQERPATTAPTASGAGHTAATGLSVGQAAPSPSGADSEERGRPTTPSPAAAESAPDPTPTHSPNGEPAPVTALYARCEHDLKLDRAAVLQRLAADSLKAACLQRNLPTRTTDQLHASMDALYNVLAAQVGEAHESAGVTVLRSDIHPVTA